MSFADVIKGRERPRGLPVTPVDGPYLVETAFGESRHIQCGSSALLTSERIATRKAGVHGLMRGAVHAKENEAQTMSIFDGGLWSFAMFGDAGVQHHIAWCGLKHLDSMLEEWRLIESDEEDPRRFHVMQFTGGKESRRVKVPVMSLDHQVKRGLCRQPWTAPVASADASVVNDRRELELWMVSDE